MAMQKHHDAPGTTGWHARRARCFNAGDASAVLGCHPSGKTRTQILQELHTGIAREFTDYVQERVIDPGHRIEALWRPIAEEIIGEDLQVVSFTLDVGLSRPLGASLDGCTFMEDILGECKSANDALRVALPHAGRDSHRRNDARQLPKGYRVQMEQQQLCSGATRTLFSACQFDAAGNPTEERHCWYESDPVLRAEILAGWKQADADLSAMKDQPAPAAPAPKVVAEPVQALPAVTVLVEGAIVIRENFDAFEAAAREFLEKRLIREPKTDQDFADLDGQIKAMKGAEAALEAAEAGWIAQIDPVSAAKRRKDMLQKLMRDNRLMAEKLLASEKERRRGELVAGAVGALQKHVSSLNERLGKPYMPSVAADFGGCIRGLKSLSSMEDKLGTELARAKIAANEAADRIDANLKTLRELAKDHAFLFADTAALVLKAPDDCRAQIEARIAAHKEEEQRRAAELAERERARIRREEEERARAQALREQQEREAAERREREEAAAQAEQQHPADRALEIGTSAVLPTGSEQPVKIGPAQPSTVVPMPTRAPVAPAGPPTLKLGEIQKRLAPVSIDTAGLAFLGFPPVDKAGSSKLYREESFPAICAAIAQHVVAAANKHREAA